MSTAETLPTKQKHLIGIGAAIAAGCQPCTAEFASAAREAGACERGARLAIESGLAGREAATESMSTFAKATFAQPEIDASFRAERAALVALVGVAAAVASNTASLVSVRVEAARALGATDDQNPACGPNRKNRETGSRTGDGVCAGRRTGRYRLGLLQRWPRRRASRGAAGTCRRMLRPRRRERIVGEDQPSSRSGSWVRDSAYREDGRCLFSLRGLRTGARGQACRGDVVRGGVPARRDRETSGKPPLFRAGARKDCETVPWRCLHEGRRAKAIGAKCRKSRGVGRLRHTLRLTYDAGACARAHPGDLRDRWDV